MKNFFLVTVSILLFVAWGSALECYVCERQDRNDDKCVHSAKICPPESDMCMTELKWGTMPYWQAGAKKQYYISKRCATKQQCVKTMKRVEAYCTHVWYEDWQCTECCGGDRCNYYIISDSSRPEFSTVLFSAFGLLMGALHYL